MDVFETQQRTAIHGLTDALPHLVWLLNAERELEYANDAFRRFTGLTLAELRSPDARFALIHPEDVPATREHWARALARADRFALDARMRRADGVYRRLRIETVPAEIGEGGTRRWIATAVDVEDLRRAELLHGITESAAQLIWVVGRPDGPVEFWNARLREYTGLDPQPDTVVDWPALVHPEDEPARRLAYEEALREGRGVDVQYRLRRHDGVYRWFLARAEPSRDANGQVVRWIGTATDIEDHKRAEEGTAMLLDATALLAGTREIDSVLPAIAQLAVRRFAGTCALFRREREGIVFVTGSDRDPSRGRISEELMRMYPPRERDAVGIALERNIPILIRQVTAEDQAAAAHDARSLAMQEELGVRSVLDVPLSARGEALGVLQFLRYADQSPFEDRDVATAQILANRIAGAIDEAMTREGERRLAETFQSSALPRRLPELPGIEVRAIYQGAEVGINVGGDWYDAFELSPWRLVVSIGDVAGKGAEAAATMSLIRHGIRFAAHRGQDPADVLGVVDNALRAENPDLTATAFVAIVDIRESRVRYASAGHPPAALRLPNGRVRLLDVEPAPPLGTWPEGLRPKVEASPLVYGSLLVLYTDGLTEVDRDPIAGERRLVAALRDDAVFASTNPARYVRDAVIDHRTVRDDVAVITLAYGRRRGWTFEAPDALRAQPARASFEQWLEEEADGDRYAAALIFGELVGNVVRHAPGPIEMRAEWRDDGLWLHVFDTGPGFETLRTLPDASAEGGRGLFIVRTLAKSLAVGPAPRGTRVTAALPVTRRPYSER